MVYITLLEWTVQCRTPKSTRSKTVTIDMVRGDFSAMFAMIDKMRLERDAGLEAAQQRKRQAHGQPQQPCQFPLQPTPSLAHGQPRHSRQLSLQQPPSLAQRNDVRDTRTGPHLNVAVLMLPCLFAFIMSCPTVFIDSRSWLLELRDVFGGVVYWFVASAVHLRCWRIAAYGGLSAIVGLAIGSLLHISN